MNITTTAQMIADMPEGPEQMRALSKGWKENSWFGGCEYAFADGSRIVIRTGRIESPHRSPIQWTPAKRTEWDV